MQIFAPFNRPVGKQRVLEYLESRGVHMLSLSESRTPLGVDATDQVCHGMDVCRHQTVVVVLEGEGWAAYLPADRVEGRLDYRLRPHSEQLDPIVVEGIERSESFGWPLELVDGNRLALWELVNAMQLLDEAERRPVSAGQLVLWQEGEFHAYGPAPGMYALETTSHDLTAQLFEGSAHLRR